MATSILSPTSQVLPNTAAIIGLVPTLLGINFIFRPRSALDLLLFPTPKDPEAQKLVDNLLRIYGARDIAIGLPTLIAWYFGHRKILGWLMIVGIITTGVDGWVSRLQIGGGEWRHWAFAPLGFGLGGGMLGWFGGQ
ncbi:hypothetical protein Q7P37_009503 [Cladosporium fusiforme]